MSDDELTFASAYAVDGKVMRVHYARCEPCMFGSHSGGWHSWAGPEDIEHAAKTGQPDPSSKRCACDCTEREPEPEFEPGIDEELRGTGPCIECGEVGACGYDTEGRALIHATWLDDDESEDA